MPSRTDELVNELTRLKPESPALRYFAVRSDYCPECHRVGCCGGEQDCAAYRRELAAALDRGLERAFASITAALLKR